MSLLHVEGFAYHGDATAYGLDYTVAGAGTLAETTMPLRRDGCTAISLADKSLTKTITPTAASVAIGCAFQWTAGAADFLRIIDGDGSTIHLTVAIDASGYYRVYRGDSATGTLLEGPSASPLTAGTPYYVVLRAVIADSGSYSLVINNGASLSSGNTMTSADTRNGGNGTVGAFRLYAAAGGALFADLFVLDGTSMPFPSGSVYTTSTLRVDVAVPYRDAEWGDWTPNGATFAWETLDETTPDSDTSYISSSVSGRRQFANLGPLAHSPVYVEAARLVAVAKRDSTGSRTLKLGHLNDSQAPYSLLGTVTGNAESLTTSYAVYSLMVDSYHTGDLWNLSAWGVECGDGTDGARVTHLCAHVLSFDGGPRARVTQFVVQTLSDSASTGEVRVTQMVVQTLTGAGDVAVVDSTPTDVRIGELMTLVAEITGTTDTTGATAKLLATDGPAFATLTTDTPASTIVHDRLTKAATMQRTMFSTGATLGAVSAGYGVCEIANTDGLLDAWADYNVAGQTFTLRAGRPGDAYPSQWVTLIRATMQAIECDLRLIRVRLRDRLEILQRAMVRDTTYPDPQIYGQVYNVPLKLIDAANLIYAAGRPPAGKLVVVQSLRDNGSRIGHNSGGDGDYSSTVALPANLAAASVGYGKFNWCPADGRVKVGSTPVGTLTATVYVIDDSATWTASGPGANAKPGTILSQLAQAGGISSADITLSDANTVDLAGGTTKFGLVATGDERILDAMNRIANSIGVWFGFDRLNLLRMAQLTAPSGTSDWSFTQHNIIRGSLRRIVTEDPGRGVPVWRVVARSNHNDSATQTFAGSVSETDKNLMRDEWPVETAAEDSSVLTWCPAATELAIDVYSSGTGTTATSASVAADDAGEAARRLALMSAQGEMVEVEAFASPLLLTSVDIGSTVTLKFPRFGWDAGAEFVVVGMQTE